MRNKLITLFILCILAGCGRPSDNAGQSSSPSFGEALESSLSQSATEEKARNTTRQRQQELQIRQQKLQQDRLKSYGDTSSFEQNP